MILGMRREAGRWDPSLVGLEEESSDGQWTRPRHEVTWFPPGTTSRDPVSCVKRPSGCRGIHLHLTHHHPSCKHNRTPTARGVFHESRKIIACLTFIRSRYLYFTEKPVIDCTTTTLNTRITSVQPAASQRQRFQVQHTMRQCEEQGEAGACRPGMHTRFSTT